MMFMEFKLKLKLNTKCDLWHPLATSGNLLGRRDLPEVSTGTQSGSLAELFFLVELAFV